MPWDARSPTPGGCATCTATWPSGATISTIPTTTRQSPTKNPRGPAEGRRTCCAAAIGVRAPSRVRRPSGRRGAGILRRLLRPRCDRVPLREESAADDGWSSSRPLAAGRGDRISAALHPTRDCSMDAVSSLRNCRYRPHRTGFVYGEIYPPARHRRGPSGAAGAAYGHRRSDCSATGLLDKLTAIEPRPAEERWLTAVHSPEHVAQLRRLYSRGDPFAGSRDTPVCGTSYTVAVAAAGGVLAAVDAVMAGEVHNAFCAVRPPGHHATRDRAMGFCLLNNVAIATRYIQQQHKLPKVLIVDWDVHHGNGTQEAFYDDSRRVLLQRPPASLLSGDRHRGRARHGRRRRGRS